jgi:hypothetical protein
LAVAQAFPVLNLERSAKWRYVQGTPVTGLDGFGREVDV